MEEKQTAVLDLRAFKPTRKKIILSDNRELWALDLLDLDFETYLEIQSLQKVLNGATTFDEQIETLGEAVHKIIPELTPQDIRKMPMKHLGMIIAFIKKNYNQEADAPSTSEDEVPLAESQQTQ